MCVCMSRVKVGELVSLSLTTCLSPHTHTSHVRLCLLSASFVFAAFVFHVCMNFCASSPSTYT